MAVPEINTQNVLDALKYIDENGVPFHNQSTQYDLVTEDGKKYPPKYVIAVADHLANGSAISTDAFNAVQAKGCLQRLGFQIQRKTYTLTITADNVSSTDTRFTIDDLGLGDDYEAVDAYMIRTNDTIRRNRLKNEQTVSNMTLPRLAFQVFEEQIDALTIEEKIDFPTCRYNSKNNKGSKQFGIFTSEEEYVNKKGNRTFTSMTYKNPETNRTFVIHCYNVFSTITFVQECLKRFGKAGDKFVLIYREKVKKDDNSSRQLEEETCPKAEQVELGYHNPYSIMLKESKNIIFRGAPGTGKSYLAKEIAADIISNGTKSKYSDLSHEEKMQVEFVQFHPSYDYTDFVEGLRPIEKSDQSIGFALKDGVFKRFVACARKNYEDSQKQQAKIAKEDSAQETQRPYIFIIDEINRGEISKIFGELFFAIDPDYRGEDGAVSTQYASLHDDPDEKFYIPENVYIIGTMNDIDRSVDSFDFAMRRRFRFIEIKASEEHPMLDNLSDEFREEAKERMRKLNDMIVKTEDLNENYQIGAAYFLKLKDLNYDFNRLWEDHLQPLLSDYIRGIPREKEIMSEFAQAYGYQQPDHGVDDEADQNQ